MGAYMSDQSDLFTDAERAALEAEVRKDLEKEEKARLKKEFKEQLMKQLRQQIGLDEAQEEVFIDLPAYCLGLRIDNVMYQHGTRYTVRASVAMSMREQMQRCWEHQSEVDGHKKDYYRAMRGTRMSGVTGAVSNGPLRA
jgi:hypothetical protein